MQCTNTYAGIRNDEWVTFRCGGKYSPRMGGSCKRCRQVKTQTKYPRSQGWHNEYCNAWNEWSISEKANKIKTEYHRRNR